MNKGLAILFHLPCEEMVCFREVPVFIHHELELPIIVFFRFRVSFLISRCMNQDNLVLDVFEIHVIEDGIIENWRTQT